MIVRAGTQGMLGVVLTFCIVLSWGGPVWAVQPGSSEVEQIIEQRTGDIRDEAAATRALLQKDKKDLQAAHAELKSSVADLRAALEDKKDAFSALEKEEAALKNKLQSEREEVEEVQGSLVTAAKNLGQVLTKSPLGPLMPEQRTDLAEITQRQELPGMDEIRSVVECSFDLMKQSGNITRFSESFIDSGGTEQAGTLVRIGGLSALYQTDEDAGYLRAGPEGRELVAAGGELSWWSERNLRAYIAAEQETVPLDISNGAVFAQMSREQTWGEWVRAGGFLVWPLFAIAGLALILVAERLIFMIRIRSNSDRIMEQITELAEKNAWSQCREVCVQNRRSPLCRVIGKALEHVGESRQVVENALQEGVLSQLPRLERFLPTLNVLAAIAPLLGLLGTVTGMISTFQAITVFGTGEPKVMAGGISEALITTQIGLGVAVPIMFLHHLLDRRVDKIIGEIEEKGAAFSLLVLSRQDQEGKDKNAGLDQENPESVK
jgi:biopolymer transport protein ExbB